MKHFKADIFNKAIPIITTLRKYCRFTNDIKTTHNIAFKNETCTSVSQTIGRLLSKQTDYEIDETLICRKDYKSKYYKSKAIKFSVNFEYKIVEVVPKYLTIRDIGSEQVYTVSTDIIKTHFIYGYCRTCHSYQGSTIKDEIAIFDWSFFYVSIKWTYTAITRTTDLNNVFIYNGKCEEYNETLLDSYFMKKIRQYKNQDNDANRPISNNYVDINCSELK